MGTRDDVALVGDDLVVADVAQANRLHNKAQVGTPLSGNRLRLEPVEAAWALATGRAAANETLAAFLTARPGLEVPYLAYADLRSRGLLVRPAGPATLAVLARGASLRDAPEAVVECRAEREATRWADLAAWAAEGRVVAVVDEDGDVTHYRTSFDEPSGDVPVQRLPVATGEILHDRVLVEGPAAQAYHDRERLGTPQDGRLLLSFLEAEHLRRRGVLQVPAALPAHAAARQPGFTAALPIYEALRAAGVVARSGLKFGTHLRGYRGDPDAGHALWLVHCARPDDLLPWSELSRGVRLAHGVRKAFLVACADPEPRFVRLDWHRP